MTGSQYRFLEVTRVALRMHVPHITITLSWICRENTGGIADQLVLEPEVVDDDVVMVDE